MMDDAEYRARAEVAKNQPDSAPRPRVMAIEGASLLRGVGLAAAIASVLIAGGPQFAMSAYDPTQDLGSGRHAYPPIRHLPPAAPTPKKLKAKSNRARQRQARRQNRGKRK